MAQFKEVRITGDCCTSQEALHAHMAQELGFPDYYGENLSALADCLSDICNPTLVTFAFSEEDLEPGMQAYMLRFVQVCARESLANECLSLIIEHP